MTASAATAQAGPPPARRGGGRWRLPAVALALLLAAVAVARLGPGTDLGARLIEKATAGISVGRVGRLNLEGLSGDPWSRFSIRRLTLSDRAGVWLDARGLQVDWRWHELFRRRVRIARVTAVNVTLAHRPILGPQHKPSPSPVSVRVDLAAATVEMTPAFAQRRGVYDVKASGDVERTGAARGQVSAASVLHPGDYLTAAIDIGAAKTFFGHIDAREAEGGALAGMAGLAADQPFLLTARAAGSVSAGRFTIASRVGAVTPLEAAGVWNPKGGSASGDIQLSASTLLARYAAMIGPTARFRMAGIEAPGGLYDLTFSADSDNAALGVRGRADVGRLIIGPGGLSIDARVNDPTRIVSYPKLGPTHLAGRLTGDDKHWILGGAADAVRAGDAHFTLARLSGPVRIEGRRGEVDIDASAAGEGGTGRGLAAALLGGRPTALAKLTVFPDGRMLMKALAVKGAGLDVTATGDRGLLGGLSFKGGATLTNLAAAHAGAHGVVKASWSASQAGAGKPWSFSFDARGAQFAAGLREADRLLGAAPRLTMAGAYDGGVVSINQSALEGAAGSATSSGLVGPSDAIRLNLAWQAKGPFEIGPLEIDGAAKGSGDLAGSFAAPRADLIADFTTVNLPSVPLHGAHLILTFQKGAAATDGHFVLTGDSKYGPAHGKAAFRFVDGGLDLSGVDVLAGGASAAGAVALRGGEPSSADLTLAAGPGAFLQQGHAQGRFKIAGSQASISLTASEARFPGGGAAVRALKLTADGPMRRLPYRLTADGAMAGGPWRIAGDGVLAEAGSGHDLSFAGAGRLRRVDLRTLSPAQFHFGGQTTTARAALAVGAGRADVSFEDAGGALAAKAEVAGLSLALLNEDLVGHVDGVLTLAGRGEHLTGGLDARLIGAGGRDLKGSPPVDGTVKARLGGGAMVVDAELGNSSGLKALGHVTLAAETSAAPFRIALDYRRPLAGRFSIDGELKPLWELAMGSEQTLEGHFVAAGTLGGTLSDPRAVGSASLDNGAFQEASTGLTLRGVTLRATMASNAIDVSQFAGTDGAKGQVTGSGRFSLAREGASSFRLDLKGFRLIENDLAHAAASGQVLVNRAADGKVKLSGVLSIDSAQIAPNPPPGSNVIPMDVVEINKPFDAEERFATPPPPASPVDLDVAIKAPRGVYVKGRGLNVELALDGHVGGTTAAPLLTGTARVVHGDYDFAGKRFTIDDRGVIYLGSTAGAIRLDLVATREDPSLTAVIKIAGTAAKPTITLSSTPVLPQDEILSQVLFGASATQLSPLEAAQLASALAGMSGGRGLDVIAGLRNFAHLDRLAISAAAPENTTVAASRYFNTGTTFAGGKYLTDKVYLELSGGSREGGGAQVEWRVRKHVAIASKVTSQGDQELSVRWRKDY